MKNLDFRRRFLLLAAIFVVGYAALLAIGGLNVLRVAVGGSLYQEISRDQDLIADIQPPSLFIVQPYLLTYQIASMDGPAMAPSRRERITALRRAVRAYEDRHGYWDRTLRDPELREALLVEADRPARAFLDRVLDTFIPAVQEEDWVKAQGVIADLALNYEDHSQKVEHAVELAKARVAANEVIAKRAVERGRNMAIAVAVAFILVVGAVGVFVLRSILRSTRLLVERVRQMAQAEADLSARLAVDGKDELTDLARWFNAFLDKIADLVRAVQKSSVQLTGTATEVAATSRQQESAVQAFGASTNQIAVAVKEISATSSELSRTMSEVGDVARDSAEIATGGRRSLEEMESAMSSLAQSSASISSRLAVISEKASDINVVVTTITKVADQTNLLSVNAAIEAEKAGEYGRGFLVVSREIRRLADQTAGATLEIEGTVKQMQSAVSAGVMEMDKFTDQVRRSVAEVQAIGGRLGQIIERVEVLTNRFDEVQEGMGSQSQGAQQISDAMGSLTVSVRQTAGALGEFTGAAEDMKGAVEGLKRELARFRLEG